jgi:hypothetical protein
MRSVSLRHYVHATGLQLLGRSVMTRHRISYDLCGKCTRYLDIYKQKQAYQQKTFCS